MPVYNVETYIDAALDSVRDQSFSDYELIVVDDGSTDTTSRILRRRARRDPRIRVVRQENAGSSAARNRGVQLARGELITFVDGDDVLTPGAWQCLVAALDRSGSDFAIGRLERVTDDGRRSVTRRMRENHERSLYGVRLDDRPEMLADVFPVNKLYRLGFWREQDLSFPEGLLYEDQPVVTRALLNGTFDVLEETVYLYRFRSHRSSTTQQRHLLRDLEHRLESKRRTVRTVVDHGSTDVVHTFFAHVLPVDMWEYFRASVGASDEYWSVLRHGTRELWNDETVPFEQTDVPVRQRLMGWFTVNDRRADLDTLIELIDTGGLEVVQQGSERILDHPWRDEPDLPVGCLVV